ncbi:MAG: hypothetical protein FI707_06020 [SAR202 cluster bacterium]|jgi:hypothetical protein|nr:hypothetical protein [SAR202 cluster bacterium]MQG68331.1 hypothetical protein [SAR202 cluster bacterium]HAL47593.1 hypothetical protein [Dehalococcoidia bacterium]|tara:strand:- start:475 stop:672 length:198 start_codon:yes stop_codon:yes gene_type:complete
MTSAYNYEIFPLDMTDDEFTAFPDVLKTGAKAPDGVLIDVATGESVRLSDYWKNGPVLIEFGSIT